jgi:hypothetical protein
MGSNPNTIHSFIHVSATLSDRRVLINRTHSRTRMGENVSQTRTQYQDRTYKLNTYLWTLFQLTMPGFIMSYNWQITRPSARSEYSQFTYGSTPIEFIQFLYAVTELKKKMIARSPIQETPRNKNPGYPVHQKQEIFILNGILKTVSVDFSYRTF